LTYIWKVDIKSIKFFEVKKTTLGVLGDNIVIYFKQEGQFHFLEFRTFELESWLKRLEEVGITDRTKSVESSC